MIAIQFGFFDYSKEILRNNKVHLIESEKWCLMKCNEMTGSTNKIKSFLEKSLAIHVK